METKQLTVDSKSIPTIAVLLPCYNEAAAIAGVVNDFRAALPTASVYVYDNNSRDETSLIAAEAGAIVRLETQQGKGNVIRRMFADIDADIYVLADGDGTYDAALAPTMVDTLLKHNVDMVVGRRVEKDQSAYRPGHRFGNALLTNTVALLFGNRFKDILSGYRVFSRRFVKCFPIFARGFEIETEITVHALTLQMSIQEIDTNYGARPAGSASKLRTYQDGFKILGMILRLLREERPLFFFGVFASLLGLLSLLLGYPILIEFLRTHLVPRFPTAILATGLALLSALSLTCGLVLDTVVRGHRSARFLAYLSIPVFGSEKTRNRV